MLRMAMSSIVNISASLIILANGKVNFTSIILALVIAIEMIASTLLLPSLIRNYTKKKQKSKELEYQLKYSDYIEKKKELIETI